MHKTLGQGSVTAANSSVANPSQKNEVMITEFVSMSIVLLFRGNKLVVDS